MRKSASNPNLSTVTWSGLSATSAAGHLNAGATSNIQESAPFRHRRNSLAEDAPTVHIDDILFWMLEMKEKKEEEEEEKAK